MVAWLTSDEAPISLDELERGIHTRGQKTMLKLWQGPPGLSFGSRARPGAEPAGSRGASAHGRSSGGLAEGNYAGWDTRREKSECTSHWTHC